MYAETRAQRVLANVLTEQCRQKMQMSRLAGRWGVPTYWAIRRLSGKAGLTGSELRHIAVALRVPVEQLLEGTDR